VLGGIDLDPATCAFAQSWIQASEFLTKKEDGLTRPWRGRVWLNPPFSKVAQFVAKLVAELEAGRISAAILLSNNCTDAGWFHQAARASAAMCFMRGRIQFEQEHGPADAPPQGQAFCYFGGDVPAFRKAFGGVGLIVTPAHP
jgi:ParB family chromosome partitioning protein